ncbi:DMT family transporter [Sinorhizobium sp. RAC02]|uniref:DMT family transporter n=1 Tax=Sinorhizobium sp. RAC02 TaxID=1842534 RepID=UPI00083D694A|nr:DMT family transporter [Sinorhizobium sp. RAC02]AOF94097.1 eamA-like transporter family protein [Sinorhizobium sp. RAC02]
MLRNLIHPDNRHALTVGIGLVIIGYFLFALNDVVAKFLVASFGVGQVLTIRAIGAFAVLVPLARQQGEHPFRNVHRPLVQILRALLITLDTALFYAAVVYLPLADVMTFYMAGPIYMTVASHFLLGERAGWRRWSAVLLGFIGVVVALDPSTSAFSTPAWFALIGGLAYALTLVLNRSLARTGDATLGIYQGLATFILAGAASVFDWRPFTMAEGASMLLLGVIGAFAHLVVTRSLKLAPVSILAPFQYTLLLWGMLFGFLFFGDIPGPNMIVGSAIIAVAGLFISHRKARKVETVPDSDLPAQLP